MTKQLLSQKLIDRLASFTQLIVGFSGGLDSTVLLHQLSSIPLLYPKLLAVHINHGMSNNALLWQKHCQQVCIDLNINFLAHSVKLDGLSNVEEKARIARYSILSSLSTRDDCLLLAHHRDDQAETLLLQLFRGAGVDGLAAMAEIEHLAEGTRVRPLLSYSREQLEEYAHYYSLKWISDESNQNILYSRNFLRHHIIPLLQEKWPEVVANIVRTTAHCQQARANLDDLALHDHQELAVFNHSLSLAPLKKLNEGRITNIVRFWLKKNKILLPSTVVLQRIIHELIFANPKKALQISWAKMQLWRYQDYLYLDKKRESLMPAPCAFEWQEFPSPLILKQYSIHLTAKKTNKGLLITENARLVIRFRQGGERFYWHGQTKQLKKLFQEWSIPIWLRDRIPLLYLNDQLAAIVGYAVSDAFFADHSSKSEKEKINDSILLPQGSIWLVELKKTL